MSRTTVQYNLLQVVTNHLSDERVTVALVHWDGSRRRIASDPKRVPLGLPSTQVLQRMVASVETMLPRLPGTPFRVEHAGLLRWSPVREVSVDDSDAHFAALRLALNLNTALPTAILSITPVTEKLTALGTALANQVGAPNVVRANHRLHGLTDYSSPVSWRNGVWHHTFPVEAMSLSTGRLNRRFELTLGKIDATVPPGEKGVIVAVRADGTKERLRAAIDFIRKRYVDHVEVVECSQRGDTLDISTLDQRIRADIAPHLSSKVGKHRQE